MARFRQDGKDLACTMSYLSAHRKFPNCLLKVEMIDIPCIQWKKGILI